MKKKILALTLCLALLVGPVLSVVAYADTGAGYTYDEATNTFTVTTADGLIAAAAQITGGNCDADIIIAADIDMANATSAWNPLCNASNMLYTGTIDGQNHTISNFTDINTAHRRGLIARAADCTVKNLTFVNPVVEGGKHSAVIIGDIFGGVDASKTIVIDNCKVINGNVKSTGSYVGALVGSGTVVANLTITNCVVDATVSGTDHVGLVVGGEQGGTAVNYTFENIVATGSVTGLKNSGAFGYFCDLNLKFKNIVSFVEANGTATTTNVSSFASNTKRCKVEMDNVICLDTPIASADALGEKKVDNATISNVFVLANESANVYKAVALNGTNACTLTINGEAVGAADVAAWQAATVPAVDIAAAEAKIATMFAANDTLKTAALNGLNAMFALDVEASGMQLLSGTTAASEKTSVRLVITLTSAEVEALTNVGAYISLTADAKTTGIKKATSCVYTSIKADDVQVNAELGTYFVLVEIQNIPNASFGSTIYVTPFVTADSGEVLGEEISFNVTGLIG